MVNDVQLENGYTRIANEILEALAKTNLNGTQRRILDVIFRQTYGYKRKEHDLSIAFISKATNIHKKQIQRELNVLIERKFVDVISEATFSKSRVIAFNKNYIEWLDGIQVANPLPPNEIDTHTGNELVPSTGNGLAPQIKKKENLKESSAKISINDFFEEVWKIYPNKKGKSTVNKKSKKAIYEIGIEKMTKAIENYKQELKRETWKQPMNGSTFFNGRYEDYLQDNFYEEFVPKDQVAGKNLKEFLLKKEAVSS